MNDLDLEESALQRGVANARRIWNLASFSLATASSSAVVGAAVGWLSYGERPLKVALLSVAALIAAYLFCLFAVFMFQWAAAPVRQRDELRSALRSGDQLSDGEIAARLSDFTRSGDDLMQGCKAGGGYTAQQEEAVDRWTGAVADFLTTHFPDGGPTIKFSRAARDTVPLVGKLEARLAVLDELIDALLA